MRTFFNSRSKAQSDNVVSMDGFRSGPSLSPIRQAEAYWTALRAEKSAGSVPFRSDIDPRGLENILEYSFILERIAPGIARFRLAGNHLSDIAGMEVRGMPLTSFFTTQSRAEISATLEHIFDTPAVAELRLTREKKFGRAALEARMLLLPLKSDFGDVSRVLGVLVAYGAPGTGAIRFDILGSELRALSGVPGGQKRHDQIQVFSETKPISAPEHMTGSHLNLVASNDPQ
jgi:hypothetical protein